VRQLERDERNDPTVTEVAGDPVDVVYEFRNRRSELNTSRKRIANAMVGAPGFVPFHAVHHHSETIVLLGDWDAYSLEAHADRDGTTRRGR